MPVYAALLPPLSYLVALALLPPFEHASKGIRALCALFKFAFAIVSIASFAVLPSWYHVPGSAILTYQLGLIGCFGACRGFDIFFLSHPRVPRRLAAIDLAHKEASGRLYPNGTLNEEWPVKPHPQGLRSRLWWALDLMISMRGVGWDFATPDVRHDTNPWQRPSGRQVRRAVFKVGPMLLVTLLGLRAMATYIDLQVHAHWHSDDVLETAGITNLPLVLRPLFVAFTGVSLYALFDFGYTIISAAPLPVLQASASVVQTGSPDDPNPLVPSAHNVDFFPLLNPLGLTAIHSVRSFWSKAWHRLFHRAFLIYGIVPFQNMATRLEYAVQYGHSALTNRPSPSPPFSDFPMGKPSPATYADPGRAMLKGRGDWGKVLGAFVASGIIHAISERAALGGRTALPHMHLFTAKGWQDTQAHLANTNTTGIWTLARLLPPFSGAGELSFFVLNGVAVIVETAIARVVMAYRRKQIDASPDKAASEKGKDSTSSSTTALKPSGGTMFGRSASLSAGKERRASYQDTTSSESDEEVKHSGQEMQMTNGQDEDTPSSDDKALSRWYDIYFQLAWTLTILLSTGELFTEGWIASGVVNEITMVQC